MSDAADELTEPPAAPATVSPTPHPRPPRPGDLTMGWRAATAATWVGVVLALAAVWNASVQLGLSTWWLGPRGDPQPRYVQFLPFLAPVMMLLATVNALRWLPWLGLASAAVVAAIGAGDLGRVPELAVIEIAISVAAAAVSLASLSGMYRAAPTGRTPADATSG